MTKLLITLFCIANMYSYAQMNTAPKLNLNTFLESDFKGFFNLEEKSKNDTKDGSLYQFKTGGFKEFIDIFLLINKEDQIIRAQLEVNRDWIKSNLPMAKDVIKSFIAQFGLHKSTTKALTDKIWHFGTDEEPKLKDPDLVGCFDVFVGKSTEYNYNDSKQNIDFKNIKDDLKGFVLVLTYE